MQVWLARGKYKSNTFCLCLREFNRVFKMIELLIHPSYPRSLGIKIDLDQAFGFSVSGAPIPYQ